MARQRRYRAVARTRASASDQIHGVGERADRSTASASNRQVAVSINKQQVHGVCERAEGQRHQRALIRIAASAKQSEGTTCVREKYQQAIGKCAGEAASACDRQDRGVSEPAAGPRQRVICGIREQRAGTGEILLYTIWKPN